MLIQKIKNFSNLKSTKTKSKIDFFSILKRKNKMLNFFKTLIDGFIEAQRLRAEFRIQALREGRGVYWE